MLLSRNPQRFLSLAHSNNSKHFNITILLHYSFHIVYFFHNHYPITSETITKITTIIIKRIHSKLITQNIIHTHNIYNNKNKKFLFNNVLHLTFSHTTNLPHSKNVLEVTSKALNIKNRSCIKFMIL